MGVPRTLKSSYIHSNHYHPTLFSPTPFLPLFFFIFLFFIKTDLDGHGSIFFAAIVQLLMELSQDLSGLLLFNAHP